MDKVMITKFVEKPVKSKGYIGRKTFKIVKIENNCGLYFMLSGRKVSYKCDLFYLLP